MIPIKLIISFPFLVIVVTKLLNLISRAPKSGKLPKIIPIILSILISFPLCLIKARSMPKEEMLI